MGLLALHGSAKVIFFKDKKNACKSFKKKPKNVSIPNHHRSDKRPAYSYLYRDTTSYTYQVIDVNKKITDNEKIKLENEDDIYIIDMTGFQVKNFTDKVVQQKANYLNYVFQALKALEKGKKRQLYYCFHYKDSYNWDQNLTKLMQHSTFLNEIPKNILNETLLNPQYKNNIGTPSDHFSFILDRKTIYCPITFIPLQYKKLVKLDEDDERKSDDGLIEEEPTNQDKNDLLLHKKYIEEKHPFYAFRKKGSQNKNILGLICLAIIVVLIYKQVVADNSQKM